MQPSFHRDSDVFGLVAAALRSAQYVRMRAAIAFRFFGVSRWLLLPGLLAGAGFFDFAGAVGPP